MVWNVVFCDEFDVEFMEMAAELQDELLAHTLLLRDFGPTLGRPTVDGLKGSKFPNMKELRFSWEQGVWRVAFAFDPMRQAVLLVAGDKRGADQRRFYKRLVMIADERFDRYLAIAPVSGKGAEYGKKP